VRALAAVAIEGKLQDTTVDHDRPNTRAGLPIPIK